MFKTDSIKFIKIIPLTIISTIYNISNIFKTSYGFSKTDNFYSISIEVIVLTRKLECFTILISSIKSQTLKNVYI